MRLAIWIVEHSCSIGNTDRKTENKLKSPKGTVYANVIFCCWLFNKSASTRIVQASRVHRSSKTNIQYSLASRFLYIYDVEQKPKTHHELISNRLCNNNRWVIFADDEIGDGIYLTYLFIHKISINTYLFA